MTLEATVLDILARHARANPGRIAIEGVDRDPLSYGDLLAQVQHVSRSLRQCGIQRDDRVALVLPDGPDAAVAFLAVASTAEAAPLNPAYRAMRVTQFFKDLPATAVIVPAGDGGPAADVARALGVRVLELVPRGSRAGVFDLAIDGRVMAADADSAVPTADHKALLLHTSGTSARPKLVPLTHRNLCAAAGYTAEALALTPSDRCLHVVPMFHIHGLVGALLAPLAAGGTVVCAPGFQPGDFLAWIDRFQPTWYTAVPTMHREILRLAIEHGRAPLGSSLQFVRSVSAPLPARLAADLERVLAVPVIQGYGMTEASPQITCNPRPPAIRKPGSVGIPAGPDVAIVDADGRQLGPREVGEIVVRGPSIMHGYDRNAAANEAAFLDGWFRTGDQGYFDEDRYLFLTGRLKEIINRGGEKISPLEVEETLLQHPAIRDAVSFGMPDERLGEIVGSAVVLKPGAEVSEVDLREFVAERLAFFKIPARIVFLDELPKGPTGKLRRVGMAADLGLGGEPVAHMRNQSDRPQTPLERDVAALWRQTLHLADVGLHDNFFVLGGDSISLVELLERVRLRFDVEVATQAFFHESTIAGLAAHIAAKAGGAPDPAGRPASSQPAVDLLVPFNGGGTGRPLFAIHAGGGASVLFYREFARRLGSNRPVYAVQPEGRADGWPQPFGGRTSVEALATIYIQAIRTVQPHGPYHLAGASFGGTIAFEMAHQLRAQGERVASLFLFSTHIRNNTSASAGHDSRGPASFTRSMSTKVGRHLARLDVRRPLAALRYVAGKAIGHCYHQWAKVVTRAIWCWEAAGWRWHIMTATPMPPDLIRAHYMASTRALLNRYRPTTYSGGAVLFRAIDDQDPRPLWTGLFADGLQIQDMPGGHLDMFTEPTVERLADLVFEHLSRIECPETSRQPVLTLQAS